MLCRQQALSTNRRKPASEIPATESPNDLGTAAIGTLYADSIDTLIVQLRARFGSGPPEPEDVAQTAFSQLVRRGDWQSIDDPGAFLFRAANNVAISEMRALGVRKRHADELQRQKNGDQGSVSNPESVLSNRDLLDRVSQVIENLPDKQRRIFEMRRFDEMTLSEIARREGISRTAVRKHLARATAAVDEFLTDHRL